MDSGEFALYDPLRPSDVRLRMSASGVEQAPQTSHPGHRCPAAHPRGLFVLVRERGRPFGHDEAAVACIQ